jgi:hypothetical protein
MGPIKGIIDARSDIKLAVDEMSRAKNDTYRLVNIRRLAKLDFKIGRS